MRICSGAVMTVDALPDDLDGLRAVVSRLSVERDAAIEQSRRRTEQNDQLRHLLRQLQRAQFGARSERLDRDQMQLALEDIETSIAEQDADEEKKQGPDKPANTQRPRRANRGALPAHLPRIHVTLTPESTVCPCCHGAMHVIGEESSQRLDKIPAQFRVIVTHRPKYGKRCRDDRRRPDAPCCDAQAARLAPIWSGQAQGSSSSSFCTGQPLTSIVSM